MMLTGAGEGQPVQGPPVAPPAPALVGPAVSLWQQITISVVVAVVTSLVVDRLLGRKR